MDNIKERDEIIDSIILDTIYKKRSKFSLEEIENEIYDIFEQRNIDSRIYGILIANALMRLLISGRFEIEKIYFVYTGKAITIKEAHYKELIEMKNKLEKKHESKKANKKLIKNIKSNN